MSWNDLAMDGPARRRAAWAVVAVMAALLAGCGDGNTIRNLGSFYPVQGKVTLPDGKPLAATTVIFVGPVTSAAKTESDGTFTFKGTQDGLPAGDYKVRLEVIESKGTAKNPIVPFPNKYLDEDSSDLTATVKPVESNSFDLKLTPGNDAAGKSAGDRRKER
jgi:predicted small secreted protein